MLVIALVVAGLAAACSSGTSDDPPPTSSGTSTPTETATEELPFDCEAVAGAQQVLNDAATAELERLGIDRSAPEAFTVILLASSQGAADYWASIVDATTATASGDLRADVTRVAEYWAELRAPLAAIEVPDSSPAAVQAAADELAAVSQSRPDDELATAQQRVQDELGATCGTQPSPEASTSES